MTVPSALEPPLGGLQRQPVWEQIRQGRRPDPDAVAEVAGSDRATVGAGGAAALREAMTSRLLGAGPLEPLLDDAGVTDVAVNGDGSVWVDRGGGMERVAVELGDATAVRQLVVRLAGLAGRRLDETAPYVDGLLPSGVRLHAVLPPIVAGGPHLTLRVPTRVALTLGDLAAREMFPPSWEALLTALVRRRVSFLVTGGTGAGKTTLLGAMLAATSPAERIVIVEDVRELRVDRDQMVGLEARPPNVEGAGEITLTTLVRQALRMRPDRLVLGEARGPEVRELLTALNTGHEGGCGTVHANSAADVVARFEALGALAGLDPAAVHAQLVSAVDVVIHVSRRESGGVARRRIAGVGVLARGPDGRPEVRPAVTLDPDAGTGTGAGTGGDTDAGTDVGADADTDAAGRAGPGWPQLRVLLAWTEDQPP